MQSDYVSILRDGQSGLLRGHSFPRQSRIEKIDPVLQVMGVMAYRNAGPAPAGRMFETRPERTTSAQGSVMLIRATRYI